ncbi:MoaD/ThiS family protein [Leucobacter zeae]|nr:MoaD/ThiS family protein [Leucobacter zeae]
MSQITVRYFAAASEAAGRDEEPWTPDGERTLDALRAHLGDRYGEPMRRVLRAGSFLVDGVVRRDGGEIEGVRVDVLPPFAGG